MGKLKMQCRAIPSLQSRQTSPTCSRGSSNPVQKSVNSAWGNLDKRSLVADAFVTVRRALSVRIHETPMFGSIRGLFGIPASGRWN
jgi:hypothetical protein